MNLLQIDNLHVAIAGEEKNILNGLNLDIKRGAVHAIMGPNGSGKSTLANVIAGRSGYQVKSGAIRYLDNDLLQLEPEERACMGIFLAFQYPVEIAGVSNLYFLKHAINAKRHFNGEQPIDAIDFYEMVKQKMQLVKMSDSLLTRDVNSGFSGGEKKRNEILQMAVLQPTFAVLDETDSGLDIDALRVVADGVNSLRDAGRSFLIITHYQRLLNYIQPDFVHVLVDGKIVASGDKNLALDLEKSGYRDFCGAMAGAARS